ncbi:MAG: hypothetical protein AABY83_14930 [Pseudomonadota bacterium]
MNRRYLVISGLVVFVCALSLYSLFFQTPGSTDLVSPHDANNSPASSAQANNTRIQSNIPDNIVTVKYSPNFKIGETYGLNFQLLSNGWFDSSVVANTSRNNRTPGNRGELQVKYSGQLLLHVYRFTNETWSLGGKIFVDALQVNNETSAYKTEVETPFTLSLRRNGELVDIKLLKGISREGENFVRQLFVQLQYITPGDNRAKWSTRETDQLGMFSADYAQLLPGQSGSFSVEKQKKNYFRVAAENQINMRAQVVSSSYQMQADTENGWIKKATGKETTRLFVLAATLSESNLVFYTEKAMKLRNHPFPANLAALDKQIMDLGRLAMQRPKTNPQLDQLAVGKNLQDALSFMSDRWKDSSSASLGREFMINYLKLHPEEGPALAQRLHLADSGLSQDQEVFLWYALAKASQPLNQETLLQVAKDENAPISSRMRSLAAMTEIEGPTKSTIAGLWDLSGNANSDIARTAILVTGALANPEQKENGAEPNDIVDELASRLRASKNVDDIVLILSSLRNTRNLRILSIVKPYLSHDGAAIRAQAYGAVINVTTSDALLLAYSYLGNERVEMVRVAALDEMSLHLENQSINEWVKTQLTRELRDATKSSQFTLKAITLVGGAISAFPDNEDFLRNWANKQINLELKKEIYKFISPTPIKRG